MYSHVVIVQTCIVAVVLVVFVVILSVVLVVTFLCVWNYHVQRQKRYVRMVLSADCLISKEILATLSQNMTHKFRNQSQQYSLMRLQFATNHGIGYEIC